jgi:hypothetical protein
MSDRAFVRYVGNADFHDGSIVEVQHDIDAIRVRVGGASGKTYVAEFPAGKVGKLNRPMRMLLYSLSELRADARLRRFAFANWHEDDDAVLEIHAETLNIYEDSES